MLHDQINKDYVTAMKAKDSLRSQTLNFLRAQFKNVIIDKKIDKLEDADVIAVIKKQVKQRKDSITQFTEAGRPELAEKEKKEMDILQAYLPAEMSEEDIQKIVAAVIEESGASSMKDMGSVMKAVGVKTAGSADNGLVSQVVKAALAG